MTYARARLWLGITGVGTMVLLTAGMLLSALPQKLLPQSSNWAIQDLVALSGFLLAFLIVMLPFDVVGGYVLPTRWNKAKVDLSQFLRRWTIGVSTQVLLFLLSGLVILAAGRVGGLPAVLAVIFLLMGTCLAAQGMLIRLVTQQTHSPGNQFARIHEQLSEWGLPTVKLVIVDHLDPGFTGGVIGLPGRETLIIPRSWIETLSAEQAAVAVARRVEAIRSGSRSLGLLVAVGWILSGFGLASLLPGAGVQSVAQLVTTCCGFTLWMFLGLLTLPSVSRWATYQLDNRVIQRGISGQLLHSTVAALDCLQDDESQRPALIETIFHPVPSLKNRQSQARILLPGAWHAARMMLFLSWSCLGLLSRAVHCNAGRPELWVMLPTD